MARVSFELPYPPSVNTYWRRVGTRSIISGIGRKYRENVNAVVKSSELRDIRFTVPVAVHIEAYPPDKRERDLDNILKAMFDSLCHAGLIKNDSLIVEIKAWMRHPMTHEGMVYIEVEECHARGE